MLRHKFLPNAFSFCTPTRQFNWQFYIYICTIEPLSVMYSIWYTILNLVSGLQWRAIGDGIWTDKAVGTAAWYGSKHCHCCVAGKHGTNLRKWCSMSYLTLENLAECDVDEATGWQRLEHAVCKVYAWTGTNRFKNGRCEKESKGIHQSICHGCNDDRSIAVMYTNKLKAETKSNYCLVDKVSNKNCPHLQQINTHVSK